MERRAIPHTSLQVSTLCLGTAFLGSYTSLDDSLQIIQRALDLGVGDRGGVGVHRGVARGPHRREWPDASVHCDWYLHR